MRATNVTPTGVERPFLDDEIIVSKTDLKGRLTYVNRLFVTISGYPEDELIGQPHNVIRHPDMPRAVFALLWERIQAGEELFGYIVNMAADGGHYWVLAHVTPTFDGQGRVVGYHSNRRTVSKETVARITAIYRDILREERRHDHTPTAIEAGRRRLDEILAETGMSYDEFVWSLAGTEEAAA
ncbi:PAS domain-containing protein [Nocardioides daejeonensis]|uniref:PAS domain-containing protein n=1 Tax=Nocardioides daejeonensis TaxID=1046556 RepID=UPI000D740AC5|nr:PAS domain-containing protein [Nocardioides daejeonensis]